MVKKAGVWEEMKSQKKRGGREGRKKVVSGAKECRRKG